MINVGRILFFNQVSFFIFIFFSLSIFEGWLLFFS